MAAICASFSCGCAGSFCKSAVRRAAFETGPGVACSKIGIMTGSGHGPVRPCTERGGNNARHCLFCFLTRECLSLPQLGKYYLRPDMSKRKRHSIMLFMNRQRENWQNISPYTKVAFSFTSSLVYNNF